MLYSNLVESQAGQLRRLMKRSTSSKSKRIAQLKDAARSVGWKVTPYDRSKRNKKNLYRGNNISSPIFPDYVLTMFLLVVPLPFKLRMFFLGGVPSFKPSSFSSI